MGVLALPGLLALITTGRGRRRWIALLLCAGALVAIGTAASRTDVVVAAVAVIAYAGLSVIGGLGPARPLVVVIAAVALAAGVAWALIGVSGKGVLARQASVTRLVEGAGETNAKTGEFKQVPREIRGAPFGGGLGTVPFQAEVLSEFTPVDELLIEIQAIARIFARMGEKKNRNRARIKFLVSKLGIAAAAQAARNQGRRAAHVSRRGANRLRCLHRRRVRRADARSSARRHVPLVRRRGRRVLARRPRSPPG